MSDDDEMPTVVFADDDEAIRIMLETVLGAFGFDIVGQGENGREGVELYKELNPDIMLLDIEMPEMNGIEALKAIRAYNPKAFVLMLSAVGQYEIIDDCITSGAFHFVKKDTPINEMGRLLHKYFDEYKAGRTSPSD